MFDKLSDNLNLLMAKTRINASELARQTGVPASTIKKIRSHNNINPTMATLIPLAQKFSITVSQLIGDIDITEHTLVQKNGFKETYLPLLTWQDAIHWPDLNNVKYASSEITGTHYNKQSFTLVIEEDNWDGFAKDSIIIIDSEAAIKHRDFALIHKEGSATPTLRQVLYDDENVYLKPVVNDYQTGLLSPQFRIIGVVIEIRKKLKK